MRKPNGFTLVESIMAMILIGFAMVTLISFLYPQVERSATPHYQMRAAHLQQSIMSRILSRAFDEQSDVQGGQYRCGENNLQGEATTCTAPASLGKESGESADTFNDVDDYIGCWWSDNASDCGATTVAGRLTDLLDMSSASEYAHFTVFISVNYVGSSGNVSSTITDLKRIQLNVDAGNYGSYPLVAFRGNY
ncbi:type IV pilus modification PilV family protein [Vibrio porteresiae]|uniref:Type II secretion system protein n=1 Tax=Vibrio porteresiae DSM 19223 TaxID=1123496 RepID=A0ABZ0QE22_9VIBR|nr:type II secretion system protein [Vibrio porteresiae]WPC74447.1 type II secretion system protein [Vibrio porteresiae DSM 19223]